MRQEDFIEAAYNNDRESSKQEQQFFVEGCEHGYQYAVEKACEVIARLYPEAAAYYEQPEVFVEQIRKAMEE